MSKLAAGLLITICLILTFAPLASGQNDPVVRLDTGRGPIFIRVFRAMVPTTANNFLDLVSRGFYAGTSFHRIENWCIQGGGNGVFVDPSTGSPRYIPLEINRNLRHASPGMVAMARSNNPNSASCQFYILKAPMVQLDGKYAIFGKVVSGMEAVYAMSRGDVIQSASLASATQGQSGTGTRGRASQRTGPVVPYEPPNEVPSSGF